MLNSLGTAEAIFLPLDRAIRDPRMGAEGYTQGCHVVPGRYYAFAGQYTTGASIAWANEVLGGDVPLETLLEEADAVPTGSHGVAFLPHLRLANPPVDDPRSRGAFVGLHTDTKRGALLRAVLEGLALESRQSLQGLVAHDGVPRPREAVAIGGVTRNALLMRIRASALNLPYVVADAPEATALGAAMLGGIGSGVYRDADDALSHVAVPVHRVEPVPSDAALYDRLYDGVYRHLYSSVRDISHAIGRYLEDSDVEDHGREPTAT
jgi:xylulokinase